MEMKEKNMKTTIYVRIRIDHNMGRSIFEVFSWEVKSKRGTVERLKWSLREHLLPIYASLVS